jgi:aminoglycoside phosphotransferase (APT) family kinase protein
VEVLGFIAGETSVFPHPDEWVRSDETLVAIGRLLRSLHDATRGFVPPEDAVWSSELADPKGGSVICHNDVCIENIVVSEGDALALLDFDFSAPGRPTWDLAMTARYWVPLLDPTSARRTGRQNLDPVARLGLLVDAYDADVRTRREFTSVLMEIEEVALRFLTERVKRGDPAFVDMWEDSGGQEAYGRRMSWLKELQTSIDSALTA